MDSPDTVKKTQYALLKAAQAKKDYGRSLELLKDLLATDPSAVDAQIMQTHLLALTGEIGLSEYREFIATTMPGLQENPIASLATGNKMLRGIQYSCSGSERIRFINALLASTERAIRGKSNNAPGFLTLKAHVYLALEDYGNFIETVAQLSRLQQAPKALPALLKIAEKCGNPHFPDFNADKVFGIGLSRTATSSLNLALKKLGYDSIHWLNPKTQAVITEKDFQLFDGFTDIPVSYQFETLYQNFPNSRFIYTCRSRESWIGSVSAHYKNIRGISSPKELDQADTAQRFEGTAHAAESNLYSRYDTWDDAFDHFQARVSQFFQDKSDDRFLELRITEGEGWEKLCAFLNKEVPDTPFPNVNKRAGQSPKKN